VTDELISTEHWWHHVQREKAAYSQKSLTQCHSVHHK